MTYTKMQQELIVSTIHCIMNNLIVQACLFFYYIENIGILATYGSAIVISYILLSKGQYNTFLLEIKRDIVTHSIAKCSVFEILYRRKMRKVE